VLRCAFFRRFNIFCAIVTTTTVVVITDVIDRTTFVTRARVCQIADLYFDVDKTPTTTTTTPLSR